MDYERRILIVDGAEGELQRLAVELMRRDYGVHYVNDLAEAQLLAQEERGQIRAVLIATSVGLGGVQDLARRLVVAPAAIIPMGERPDDEVVADLSRQGVRWQLWGAAADEAIRFVLASVLSEQDPFELRFYLRVPTHLTGSLEVGEEKGDVALRDISVGGACLLGRIVGAEGDTGRLRFSIGKRPLDLPVRIAWCADDSGDGVGVAGVAFSEVDPETGQAIDELVDGVVGKHRLRVESD